ncbi:putative Serine/threonine protein kinase OSK3 [Blattamonas nauphoetae]|uniref:non-specific serine/threonine protein kinase n=1 Tax=Blattamonas nauphoetae TaxID=2049346 RepID=A0ABQ9WUH9_9EUKA|nr:putative Serine/threonine protein kinase OSK3 [Blattamonas nauphoetae]
MSTPRPASQQTLNKVKRVGNYLLGKTIGRGSFGKVKLATHTITGEKVAAKILDKEKIRDVGDMERITREINVLKLLYHPNILRLYEVIDTQRHIYIITEYVEGGELFDYIVHHGRLKEREACRFFHMLLNGVDYCHQHGVIHRDLKPENLLLDGQRALKIIDFGLSNRIRPGSLLKTACGSPCYAAPEMIEGKMYDGRKSDLWSCGVILFALVCGFLPFEDSNTQALYQKILHARYRCPSSLSADCRSLISKILEVDPEKRYTVDQIRQHPWFIDNFVGQHIDEIPIADFSPSSTPLIDAGVVNELESLGYSRDTTIQCIRQKKHNQIVASYRLLLEKKIREAKAQGSEYIINPIDLTPPPLPTTQTTQVAAIPPTITPTTAPPTASPPPQTTSKTSTSPQPNTARRNSTRSKVTRSDTKPEKPAPAVSPAGSYGIDKDEAEMIRTKKEVTEQSRRRHSLFPSINVRKKEEKKEEKKDEKKKKGTEAIAALPDDDEEMDITALQLTTQKKEQKKEEKKDDEDGEEMPASIAQRQHTQKTKRMSIANQHEAIKAYEERKEKKEEEKKAGGGEKKELRVWKTIFNVSATSTKPPEVIMGEVQKQMKQMKIECRRPANSFTLKCHFPEKGLRFEVEICRLPRLEEVCFVNMKRMSGETFVWKEFCTQFFASLQL